jgi:hypothetical protein
MDIANQPKHAAEGSNKLSLWLAATEMLFEPLKNRRYTMRGHDLVRFFRGEFHFRRRQLFFATFFFCLKKKVEHDCSLMLNAT